MSVITNSRPISELTLRNPDRPWRQMIRCDTPSGDFDVINKCIEDHRPQKLVFAEGDSWFDKFTPIPNTRTNLLGEIRTPFHTVVVDVSTIGDESRDMVHGQQAWRTKALFRFGMHGYDAILLSAGGNDLKNLYAELLVQYQAGGIGPENIQALMRPSAYIGYFQEVIKHIQKFISFRNEAANPTTKNAPIILHGYDYIQPRPAKAEVFAGGSFGRGPWLYPVLKAAGFDDTEMRSAADAVVDQLNAMLAAHVATLPNVHVIDSRGLLTPAGPGTTAPDGDWLDEIHPSSAGFEKLARCCWNQTLAQLLGWMPEAGDLALASPRETISTALS